MPDDGSDREEWSIRIEWTLDHRVELVADDFSAMQLMVPMIRQLVASNTQTWLTFRREWWTVRN